MAFEFFFGVFGLISSDSKSRHKSRLENDWRLFTPLSTSLFKDSNQQQATTGGAQDHGSSPANSTASSGSSQKNKLINSHSGSAGDKPQGGLFSSSGTLNASSNQSTG